MYKLKLNDRLRLGTNIFHLKRMAILEQEVLRLVVPKQEAMKTKTARKGIFNYSAI